MNIIIIIVAKQNYKSAFFPADSICSLKTKQQILGKTYGNDVDGKWHRLSFLFQCALYQLIICHTKCMLADWLNVEYRVCERGRK